MDPEGCLVCGQPDANCFRSNRRAFSFDVLMVHAFEELIVVPCHAREMLQSFVDKWVIAECNHGSVYHFHVEKTEARTYLCGPFWRSFVDAYVVDENDIVEFTYDESSSKFDIVVFNADRDEKPWVQLPDCWEILECCRVTFEKTIFSDVIDINSAEMNAVTFAIFKELNKVEESEYLDFFEVPRFFVHRLNGASVTHLLIPFDVAHRYDSPREGTAVFYSRYINGQMVGAYTIHKGQHIEFADGWNAFCGAAHFGIGSLLCVKIELRDLCIRLDIEDITL